GAAPRHFAWAGPRANDVAPVAAARERVKRENEDEHRRLLYVAMTRASERLIVCGAEGERGRPPGCWWNLVADALQPPAAEEPADDGEGKVWRYRPVAMPAVAAAASSDRAAGGLELERPDWLEHAAPREAIAMTPLSPSRSYDEEHAPFRAAAAAGAD